jgi:hypothetical protein
MLYERKPRGHELVPIRVKVEALGVLQVVALGWDPSIRVLSLERVELPVRHRGCFRDR